MAEWDDRYDIVVVGTGASGLVAALTASNKGMKTLVIEKLSHWGGTTALSGGGFWIPANYLIQENGGNDSFEDALEYMEATIKDVGPASSKARKTAYLINCSEMALFLKNMGFKWVQVPLYPDYYPMAPGAKIGRILHGDVFNKNRLGKWRKNMIPTPHPEIYIPLGKAHLLPHMMNTFEGFLLGAYIVLKTTLWKLTGKSPCCFGASVTAQLMHILQSRYKVPVWLSSPLKEIIVENNSASGVVVERNGKPIQIKSNKGIMLAAGGFARNDEYRKKYQPVDGQWSLAAEGDTGDGIEAAHKVGACLALMEDAWWMPSLKFPDKMTYCLFERSFPGTIVVDRFGKRYVNESTSYIDMGHRMLDLEKEHGGTIPSWLIMDNTYRKNYLLAEFLPRFTPKSLIKNGILIKAQTLDELARQCDIDADELKNTVKRFNGFAVNGIDADFGRGNDIYDRYYGDLKSRPNPNLRPIVNAPYWAIRLYLGDLGTKGGLLTDEYARVLREDKSVIEGLYASGNNTASVMGKTYPGPGATLGPAATFSYIAMKHAAKTAHV